MSNSQRLQCQARQNVTELSACVGTRCGLTTQLLFMKLDRDADTVAVTQASTTDDVTKSISTSHR